jgi:hypothetical protein
MEETDELAHGCFTINHLELTILPRKKEPRMFDSQNAGENLNAAFCNATITVCGQGY